MPQRPHPERPVVAQPSIWTPHGLNLINNMHQFNTGEGSVGRS